MTSFDLHQLRIFVEVVKEKSFSKAAENLMISQPTVSVHIQNLEAALGVRLIDRVSRKALPTEAGERLFRYARLILRLSDRAYEVINGYKEGVGGGVVVASSTIPGNYLLPSYIALFSQRYPQCRVKVNITDSAKAISKVAKREVPLAFVGAKYSDKRLEFHPLVEDSLVVVAPASHPLAQSKSVALRELLAHPLVMREEGSGTRLRFEEALREGGISPATLRVVAELGSTVAILEAVKAGLGVAVTSKFAAKDVGEGLVCLDFSDLNVKRWFYMVTNTRMTLSPAVERFVEVVKKSGDVA